MSQSKDSSQSSNTRWWESYLVRYLSGSIIGAFCILLMMYVFLSYTNHNLNIASAVGSIDYKYFPATGLILVLIISGLIYSYLISSPITVIHYGRGGKQKLEKVVRYIWFGWIVSVLCFIFTKGNFKYGLIVMVAILLFLYFNYAFRKPAVFSESCTRGTYYYKVRSRHLTPIKCVFSSLIIWVIGFGIFEYFEIDNFNRGIFLLGFPTLSVGVMQYVTIFRILNSESQIFRFYRKLVKSRLKNGSKDIRETYSHLREHSNATFIVFLEICVTCFIIFLIYFVDKNDSLKNTEGQKNLIIYLVGFFAFWLMPNLFMWSRANNLEKDFINNNEKYLIKEKEKSWTDTGESK
ncbi:hypothetical protein N5C43_16110 [Comamonas terrigena]|uniref:hypothetical protein n=1 Tax=Comamonas terrigena TaxID=32013 RepID=UPI00244B8AEE|nr:hypothetical protein [Comamonas terrigena]MDH1292769.1 hypothetical protein [Comamonas terrigena]